MEKMIGTVKWFATKGESFGFLNYKNEAGWHEVYFHYKQIGTAGLRPDNFKNGKWFKSVVAGDVVSFGLGNGFGFSNGSQAIDIEVVKYAGDY